MGEIAVSSDHLWGAQTERSIHNFPIGRSRFVWGRAIIESLGILKKAAALANAELEQIPQEVADLIVRSALSRRESRGLHYTTDWPALLPQARDTILMPGVV